MKNRYLEILELQPGATEAVIKKAYRRLSKKYHPDISKVPNAKQKFIEITEAYDFLLEVGPTPHNETIGYDFNPEAKEFEKRREWARRRAEREAAEREKNSIRVDNFLRKGNWLALAFAVLFVFDLILPSRQVTVTITDIYVSNETPKEGKRRESWIRSNERISIQTSDGKITISSDNRNQVYRGEKGLLGKTMVYGLGSYYISSTTRRKHESIHPVFGYFMLFPILTLITSSVALRAKQRSVLWNFGSVALVLLPIAAFIVFSSA